MRSTILIPVLFTLFVAASGQQTTVPSPALTKTDYLKKSKKQKTIAWTMLAGGMTIGFIGLTQINLAGSDGDINNTPGTIMFFTGVASSLASIPFFIASSKNKKKAMSVSLKNELISRIHEKRSFDYSIPSISISMTL